MPLISAAGRRQFQPRQVVSSLRQRNYRLFFLGQLVSVAGTWMQTVAQSFLVLGLTHSGTQLGLTTAARFLPMLLFGPMGGLIADRMDSVSINMARIIGAALGGVIAAGLGLALCFACNALSFGAVLISLAAMRKSELFPARRVPRERGQVRQGLRYVRSTPELIIPLVMIAVIGTLAWEFPVTLPLMARRVFHGGAAAYGLMASVMGIGGGPVVGWVGQVAGARWALVIGGVPTLLCGVLAWPALSRIDRRIAATGSAPGSRLGAGPASDPGRAAFPDAPAGPRRWAAACSRATAVTGPGCATSRHAAVGAWFPAPGYSADLSDRLTPSMTSRSRPRTAA